MTHWPRRRFSQNFLHEARVTERMVAAIAPRAADQIVEIGPGEGALTRPLLALGARLHALELDRDLAAALSAEFAAEPRFSVENVDALKADLPTNVSKGYRLRVVGNLPYHIATPLLFRMLAASAAIADMHFLLQREVVTRMAAGPGGRDYGRLSVMSQWHARVEPLFDVAPGAFRPPPKVTSTFVRLVPHATPPADAGNPETLAEVVARAFGQRRKTLRNSLGGLLGAGAIAAAGVDPAARAETLSLEAFASLARAADAAGHQPGRHADATGLRLYSERDSDTGGGRRDG